MSQPPPIPLDHLDEKTLKRLRYDGRSIKIIAVLWIAMGTLLAVIGFLSLIASGNSKDAFRTPDESTNFAFMGVLLFVFGVLYILGGSACLKWTRGGRICSIVLAVFSLLNFPLGTVVGLLALVYLLRAPGLFGPNRYNYPSIKAELQRRRSLPKTS